ncbi:hypothetical protein MLD38_035480 [Melastoma candidum]|uniref:Uncharacterized protein n=1 Tax=Melastoma candidum TaxID=119954 RepID=A0ACB9LGX5_9MYRT|nr:hypothetical protein MLD38_035480 [Melastoma candidum]
MGLTLVSGQPPWGVQGEMVCEDGAGDGMENGCGMLEDVERPSLTMRKIGVLYGAISTSRRDDTEKGWAGVHDNWSFDPVKCGMPTG